MLAKAESTLNVKIIGYDDRFFTSKKGMECHIAEIYYINERETDEEKGRYGYKAESFTYFFADDEDKNTCDIADVLKAVEQGKVYQAEMKGSYKDYKFVPSKIIKK